MIDVLPEYQGSSQGWPWEAPPNGSTRPGQDTHDSSLLPTITVVTPSYNQGEFLEQTLRSVLLQDYPNLEYIVVDGDSSDQSGEILDRYAEHLTHLIREPDHGQSDAICKGIELATGQWFNWINSDDCLLPGTLWELARQIRAEIDLYTFTVSVEGAGLEPYPMHNRNLSARAMLRADRYSFSQPGMWFRLDRLLACGGIDRSLNYGFDWDLIVRYLNENPRVHYSTSVGAMFRLHDQSKTVVESSKDDVSESQFRQESQMIRDKLESCLPADLAAASRLGRRREPWNEHLIRILDDFDRSPLLASLESLREAAKDPSARFSWRTCGSVARLLSRYVRPSRRG